MQEIPKQIILFCIIRIVSGSVFKRVRESGFAKITLSRVMIKDAQTIIPSIVASDAIQKMY